MDDTPPSLIPSLEDRFQALLSIVYEMLDELESPFDSGLPYQMESLKEELEKIR